MGHDVTYMQNPFPWMRTTDEVLGVDQVYAAEEFRPRTALSAKDNMTRIERIRNFWVYCFGTEMPDRWDYGALYSSGIIGARRDRMVEFLKEVLKYFGMAKPERNRNMVVFARVIIEKYFENVFVGYPLHSQFMEAN